MVNGAYLIMVDTCVWLDRYVVDRPHFEQTKAFFAQAHQAHAQLLYGAGKLETFFYLVGAATKAAIRRQTGTLTEADAVFAREYAWGCVENVRQIATAADLGEADLWLATKYRKVCPDFEENTLMATCVRVGADYLVTWDEGLLRVAGAMVRAVTPDVMTQLLQA